MKLIDLDVIKSIRTSTPSIFGKHWSWSAFTGEHTEHDAGAIVDALIAEVERLNIDNDSLRYENSRVTDWKHLAYDREIELRKLRAELNKAESVIKSIANGFEASEDARNDLIVANEMLRAQLSATHPPEAIDPMGAD